MRTAPLDASRASHPGLAVLAGAVVAVAVAVEPLRLPLLAAVIAAAAVARARRSPAVWLWAALVPVAIRLAWDAAVAAPGPSLVDCANPFAPVAMARAIEAIAVLAPLAVLGLWLRASPASLGLRLATWRLNVLSVGAVVVLVPVGLFVGPWLARPFFGPVVIETGAVAAGPAGSVAPPSANAPLRRGARSRRLAPPRSREHRIRPRPVERPSSRNIARRPRRDRSRCG